MSNASKANGNTRGFGGGTLTSVTDEHSKCLYNSTTDMSNGGSGLDQSAVVAESLEAQHKFLSSSYEEIKNSQECLGGSRDAKDNDSYNFYQVTII